jgi:hypothetical protein
VMDFVNKLRNVSLDLEKLYIKGIISMIDVIYEECDVVERGTKKFMSKEELIARCRLVTRENICKAMCQSGSKCIRKCIDGGEYCKMHIGLSIKDNMNSMVYMYEKKQMEGDVDVDVDVDVSGMRVKFIEDKFYYVDEVYIYDRGTKEKVGYISKEGYILTDDPFVLGAFE